jgi:hypothetical protein
VFSGNVTGFLLSVWLHDPSFENVPPGQRHTFNIEIADANVDPSRWWEIGVGVDNFNNVIAAVFGHSPSETGFQRVALAPAAWPACRTHMLISCDIVGGMLQVYLNDEPLVLEPASSVGPIAAVSAGVPFASSVTLQEVMTHGDTYVSDLWFSQRASFVDLTITANRRKFINADGTAVDLGPTGAGPFGAPSTLFQTLPAAAPETDFLINRGSIGGTLTSTTTIVSVGDPCASEPPVETERLAMDNVLVVTEDDLSQNLVSLRWSDDRGHSFGSPVSQSIGEIGEYRRSLSWQRLAYARDRMFEVSWSVPMPTALLGAWIEVTPAGS